MLTLVEHKTYLIVTLNLGEANLNNADLVKMELIRTIDKYQRSLILNLEKVTYVDSSFLGALVAALKHAISMKLDIVLVGLQKDIHNLLKLIRLDKVFKIYSKVDDVPKTL